MERELARSLDSRLTPAQRAALAQATDRLQVDALELEAKQARLRQQEFEAVIQSKPTKDLAPIRSELAGVERALGALNRELAGIERAHRMPAALNLDRRLLVLAARHVEAHSEISEESAAKTLEARINALPDPLRGVARQYEELYAEAIAETAPRRGGLQR